MQILKKSYKKILLFDADNFFLRLRGLIGRNLNDSMGLLISPCNQIHTFYMKYPIDAIFVSKKNEIVHIEENMRPNKIGKRIRNAKRVIELKSGISKQLDLELGNILVIEKMKVS